MNNQYYYKDVSIPMAERLQRGVWQFFNNLGIAATSIIMAPISAIAVFCIKKRRIAYRTVGEQTPNDLQGPQRMEVEHHHNYNLDGMEEEDWLKEHRREFGDDSDDDEAQR